MADAETLNGREFTIDLTLSDKEQTRLNGYVDRNAAQAEAAAELQKLRNIFVSRARELATTLPLDSGDIEAAQGLFKPIIDSENKRRLHAGQVLYLADRGFNIGGSVELTNEDTDAPKFRVGQLAVAAVNPETNLVLAGIEIFDDEDAVDPSHELGFVIDPSLHEQTASGLMVPFNDKSEVVAQMSDRLLA